MPSEAVNGLGTRLHQVWKRYRSCFKTRTRDTSDLAYVHLRGQLTMDRRRNFAQIDARLQQGDGQPLQHFMSNSPWSSRSVFAQLQAEVRDTPGLEEGSVLILDESADEKAGPHSAGAGRQHNGRLGKIGPRVHGGCHLSELCQSGAWVVDLAGWRVVPARGLVQRRVRGTAQTGRGAGSAVL